MSEKYTLMRLPARLVETVQGIANGTLVAVPKEPTQTMLMAAHEAETQFASMTDDPCDTIREQNRKLFTMAYRAMLAAAKDARHD